MPKFGGAVLAVVTNAVYLTTHDDEILWLAQERLPAHTRAILATFDANTLRTGMSVRTENHCLVVGEVAMDLRGAIEWRPPTITQSASFEVVSARVHEAQSVIARSVRCDQAAFASNSQIGDCFANIARTDITQLASACRNLIGLGAGLTPAGDDFVGGLLFGVQHLQKTYPATFRWDARPIDALIEYARTQTNRISFAILRDLAFGEGPEPLHDFITALLRDKNTNDLQSSITRVLAIGHTSGRDMLHGALTGIELMLESTMP